MSATQADRTCGRVAPSKLQEGPFPATHGTLYAQARCEKTETREQG
jgi:hypothetical protein